MNILKRPKFTQQKNIPFYVWSLLIYESTVFTMLFHKQRNKISDIVIKICIVLSSLQLFNYIDYTLASEEFLERVHRTIFSFINLINLEDSLFTNYGLIPVIIYFIYVATHFSVLFLCIINSSIESRKKEIGNNFLKENISIWPFWILSYLQPLSFYFLSTIPVKAMCSRCNGDKIY